MKNQRERYRIGLILMTLSLIGVVINGVLWATHGGMLNAGLIIFDMVLFTFGATLSIYRRRP